MSLVVICFNFSPLQQKPHDYYQSVVVAKIWYLKNVRFLLGHPVIIFNSSSFRQAAATKIIKAKKIIKPTVTKQRT